jgi:pilus assembly protein CpaB
MNTRRTTLLVAILLAIGTGWLTLNYINGIKGANAGANQQRVVLVASSDIPARTTITPAMVKRVTVPATGAEPDALSDTVPAVGSLSLISIPAGAQLTASKVGRPSDVGLPVRLDPGMRAVSIQIDKVKGVSGLVQPGDRVDIIAIPPRSGNDPPPAAAILRGIKVLAVGTTLEQSSATPSPQEQQSTTVTLEVTPRQADLIAMADTNATLRLALRSPKEPLNSEPTEALRFPAAERQEAAAPQQQQPQPQPPAPAPRAQVAKTDPTSGIMVIDGDTINYVPVPKGKP